MMPQMNENEPIRERPSAVYGGYAGSQEYSQQQQYGTPYEPSQPQGAPIDDNTIEAIAHRVAQIIGQGSGGKVYKRSRNRPSVGMRLTLAIVSLAVLVPLAAILVDGARGVGGLIGFGIVCLTAFLINAVFSES